MHSYKTDTKPLSLQPLIKKPKIKIIKLTQKKTHMWKNTVLCQTQKISLLMKKVLCQCFVSVSLRDYLVRVEKCFVSVLCVSPPRTKKSLCQKEKESIQRKKKDIGYIGYYSVNNEVRNSFFYPSFFSCFSLTQNMEMH